MKNGFVRKSGRDRGGNGATVVLSVIVALAVTLVPGAAGLWASEGGAGERAAVSWAASSTGLPTSANFYGIALADFNNDGALDIVGAAESSGLKVYMGDGAGNWTAVASQPSTSGGYNDVRAGDINNDGNADIVAGSTGIKIYRGNGNGGFTDISSGSGLPTSDQWRGVALGDVNKDGFLDIATTCGYGYNLGIRVYTGNGTGKFLNNSTGLPTNSDRDSSVVFADFNNDTNLDLAAGGAAGVDVFLGNGGSGGAMCWTASSTGLPDNRFSGVNSCDFDNDGLVDIILGAYNAGSGVGLRAYRNVNKAASWTSASTGLNASGDFIDVSPGDFDGDGNVDILASGSYASTYGIRIYYGDGAGSWTYNGVTFTYQNVGNDVGDLNNDGNPDFVMGSYSNRGIAAYRNLNVVIPVPQPSLALNSPLGGASWSGGSTRTISWEAKNGTSPYNLTLSYSTDGGTTYPDVIASQIPQADNGTRSYDWVLPSISSTDVRVRVNLTDARDRTAAIASPQSFEIDSAPPTVVPVRPLDGASGVSNSTTVWVRFSEQMNQTAAEGAVSIFGPGSPLLGSPKWYAKEVVFNTSGLQLGQRYDVTISTAAMDDSDPGNHLAAPVSFSFNTSDAPIPAVTLDSPQGTEVWMTGEHHDIIWTASGGTGELAVSLEYSTTGPNGTWTTIASNQSNDGLYDWLVPNLPSVDCFVRVAVTDGFSPPKNASAICAAAFTIREAAIPLWVNLQTPNGGETWRTGTRHDISWSSGGGNGPLAVLLHYSTSGAAGPWTNISSNHSDDGLYDWLVPDTPASGCFVRVTVTDSYSPPQVASDASNVSFTIMAAPLPLTVSLTSPNGGENWTVGSRRNITWTATGGLAPLAVALEYSTTGPAGPWSAIASGLANNGSRAWVVPNATSSDCYVRVAVTDGDAPPVNATDASNGAFTISVAPIPGDTRAPQVRIISPVPSQICKGTVQLTLNATDDSGVTKMEVFLDGVSLATIAPAEPSFHWNTAGYSNGAHVLTARAWDAAGNIGEAAQVNFTVDNRKPVPVDDGGFVEEYGMILALVCVLAVVAIVLGSLLMRRKPSGPVPEQQQRIQEPPQQAFPQAPPSATSPPAQISPAPPPSPPPMPPPNPP